MRRWPKNREPLLDEYIHQLPVSKKRSEYRRAICLFHELVTKRGALNRSVLRAWLRSVASQRSVAVAIVYATWVDRFLDWLVTCDAIAVNPFVAISKEYGCRGIAPIAKVLLDQGYKQALEALRPPVRFGSHLGPDMQAHIERMRTLGLKYDHECWFVRFDRFLQNRPGAENESLSTLVREHVALAPSAVEKLRRISIGRILARALTRSGRPTLEPKWDRLLVREMNQRRHKPYIFTESQIEDLLRTALAYPSPFAPSRPLTLYTMLVLAYCAGLRVGELVRLTLKDVDLAAGTIEIHETKFFKSRRLPLSRTALSALAKYLEVRHPGIPTDPETRLFWNERRPYSLVSTKALLRDVLRRAGIKAKSGRVGPRVHDLRHTFVVHRMTIWYREGLNPQKRLPYLSAYLGHRDINSTLVYLTITQELLQHASHRFKSAEPEVMKAIRGKD